MVIFFPSFNTKFCKHTEESLMCRPIWLCTVLYESYRMDVLLIYSNKKETSNFHGTVSLDPVKMSQQKNKPNCLSNVTNTQNLVII